MLPYVFFVCIGSVCFVILFFISVFYSTSSPFTGAHFLQTPTNGKTALSEVKTLWAVRLGELKTHEM